MLAGRYKISLEEKERRAQVMIAMRPGVSLEFITNDYHEDDKTPHGFHERGDVVKLVSIIEKRPIVKGATKEIVDYFDVWLLETRYGLMEKDSIYLAAMTKVKDET